MCHYFINGDVQFPILYPIQSNYQKGLRELEIGRDWSGMLDFQVPRAQEQRATSGLVREVAQRETWWTRVQSLRSTR